MAGGKGKANLLLATNPAKVSPTPVVQKKMAAQIHLLSTPSKLLNPAKPFPAFCMSGHIHLSFAQFCA